MVRFSGLFRRTSSTPGSPLSTSAANTTTPTSPISDTSTVSLPRTRPSPLQRNVSVAEGAEVPQRPEQPDTSTSVIRKTIVTRAVPPRVTVQEPSPDLPEQKASRGISPHRADDFSPQAPPTPKSRSVSPSSARDAAAGKGKLYDAGEHGVLTPGSFPREAQEQRTSQIATPDDYFGHALAPEPPVMPKRKIWLRRPGASPTLVQVTEDDLVDDVRDMVLRKYSNSLGRTFDGPDVMLRILPRERSQPTAERVLEPEEPMLKMIDAYYPGGQSVEEALVIDVPQRRTPRPSPRIHAQTTHYVEDTRPVENGTEYFPPMPASSPGGSHMVVVPDGRVSYHTPLNSHSIAVLETGQIPALPSSPRERKGHHRPKYARQHTSSPTTVTTTTISHHTPRRHQTSVDLMPTASHPPNPPALPTSPGSELPSQVMTGRAATPPLDRSSSPRPKARKSRKPSTVDTGRSTDGNRRPSHHPHAPVLDGVIPPINVLIVEDNIINLKLLEAMVKRLKVRSQSAMNGREAVNKWRAGGFHLVLMDIQLPIMNGLEATKEIRRLERVNKIGVFARSGSEEVTAASRSISNDPASAETETVDGADQLPADGLFKSPVIIVALTASSLQSDRHEALAAGCNDFLTKPVNFTWFERKVMEWGCMQALIDFDGWRKWKAFAEDTEKEKQAKQKNLTPAARKAQEEKEARRAATLARMKA